MSRPPPSAIVVHALGDAGERQGDAARERDRSLEPDALVVAEVVEAHRQADARFGSGAHLDTYTQAL
jgi:hypothetical protein